MLEVFFFFVKCIKLRENEKHNIIIISAGTYPEMGAMGPYPSSPKLKFLVKMGVFLP